MCWCKFCGCVDGVNENIKESFENCEQKRLKCYKKANLLSFAGIIPIPKEIFALRKFEKDLLSYVTKAKVSLE